MTTKQLQILFIMMVFTTGWLIKEREAKCTSFTCEELSESAKSWSFDLWNRTKALQSQFRTKVDALNAGYHDLVLINKNMRHFNKFEYFTDEHELDPAHPEAFFSMSNSDEIAGVLYIRTLGNTEFPTDGLPLAAFHLHPRFCISNTTWAYTPCGGFRQFAIPPTTMIHVWFEPPFCGPFAASASVICDMD